MVKDAAFYRLESPNNRSAGDNLTRLIFIQFLEFQQVRYFGLDLDQLLVVGLHPRNLLVVDGKIHLGVHLVDDERLFELVFSLLSS